MNEEDRKMLEEIRKKQDEIMEMLQKIYDRLPWFWFGNMKYTITGTSDTDDVIDIRVEPDTTEKKW